MLIVRAPFTRHKLALKMREITPEFVDTEEQREADYLRAILPRNIYEERQLLRKLNSKYDCLGYNAFPHALYMLRRKLTVRAEQRLHGIGVFDVTAELQSLAERGRVRTNQERIDDDVRQGQGTQGCQMLDRFQKLQKDSRGRLLFEETTTVNSHSPSDLPIRSPFTEKLLQPYYLQMTEMRMPLKLRLNRDIQLHHLVNIMLRHQREALARGLCKAKHDPTAYCDCYRGYTNKEADGNTNTTIGEGSVTVTRSNDTIFTKDSGLNNNNIDKDRGGVKIEQSLSDGIKRDPAVNVWNLATKSIDEAATLSTVQHKKIIQNQSFEQTVNLEKCSGNDVDKVNSISEISSLQSDEEKKINTSEIEILEILDDAPSESIKINSTVPKNINFISEHKICDEKENNLDVFQKLPTNENFTSSESNVQLGLNNSATTVKSTPNNDELNMQKIKEIPTNSSSKSFKEVDIINVSDSSDSVSEITNGSNIITPMSPDKLSSSSILAEPPTTDASPDKSNSIDETLAKCQISTPDTEDESILTMNTSGNSKTYPNVTDQSHKSSSSIPDKSEVFNFVSTTKTRQTPDLQSSTSTMPGVSPSSVYSAPIQQSDTKFISQVNPKSESQNSTSNIPMESETTGELQTPVDESTTSNNIKDFNSVSSDVSKSNEASQTSGQSQIMDDIVNVTDDIEGSSSITANESSTPANIKPDVNGPLFGWPRAPFHFRHCREEHIPQMNRLARSFFWPGINLHEALQYPEFTCVALYKHLVIGFGVAVPTDGTTMEAYLSFLLVHPEWRRAGVAGGILYCICESLREYDVTLHVSPSSPGMVLYQKFGFKCEEFISNFYDKYLPDDSQQSKHAFYMRRRRM